MLLNIENKLKSKDNKVLLSNFFSLSALQMATYFFPLITFPYLVRILGIELFGILAMATAIVAYFQIIVDYGFDLSATKEISIHREDRSKLIEIFSSVLIIKFILMSISFILLTLLIFSFDKLAENWEVYYFSFGLVIGQILFPIWFFQGIEKMKYITILTIISKFIFTISIFIFVKESTDYEIVPLLYAIGSIVSGLISLYIIKKDFNITIKWQKLEVLKKYLHDGWYIFVQRFYVNLYTTTNIVILGILTSDTVVGFYAIAKRVIDIFAQLFKVVSNVYYPYFSKKFVFNPKHSLKNLAKLSFFMLILSSLSMLMIFAFDKFIVILIAGENYNEKILEVLRILSFGIVLIPFFSLFTTTLVAINQSFALKNIARDTALISMIAIVPAIYLFEEKGLAYLLIVLQIIIIFRYTSIIFKVNKSLKNKDNR